MNILARVCMPARPGLGHISHHERFPRENVDFTIAIVNVRTS